ncbi:uncharacterized bromodomain-containing protein 10 isoform X2 [Clinocottus analis]|uniref:uncharacterized bromodomain-containing protein 10 isoform X2 n=1 Tax=Clinocottus analis TaxID=304258 RepID=UPI0035BFD537
MLGACSMDQLDLTEHILPACNQLFLCNQDLTVTDQDFTQQPSSNIMSSQSKWVNSSTEDTDLILTEDGLSNGTCEVETLAALYCPGDNGDVTAESDGLALGNDGVPEFSNSDLSLPEVCISTNSNNFEEDMNYEVQQAYRIFTGFLSDKHKGITGPFLNPIGHQESQHGIEGVRCGQAQLRQPMCLRGMKQKFINQEYENITEFVADFRLMLENCYRYHGVDHWVSKQAQKLEIMLEQKLTLLSRTLREKTTLTVTSKGRFGAEEERGLGGTSTRRRLAPRSLATITVGGHESFMVQALRLEEQQRAKEEKRQRELEKKEAEEMSAKEVEEWEQTLLTQASPHTMDTLWELPAIGHFLCLAQTALNLPEIVFFDLERCLLMPRCSLFLSKIMSSLLCPPQRRANLQRRPVLPYRRWESELRQRVMGWYRAVGASHDQPGRAEQLGLSHQFFRTLGEVNPLEEKPFHLLPLYQRVWLLKGLCDNVYETQKYVQDALLAQPIHECRESILGYDGKENCYIHFPHFCGADLRIYCQSPGTPPVFPFPSVWVKRVDIEPGTEGEESDGMKEEGVKIDSGCYGGSMDTGELNDFEKGGAETICGFKGEKREVAEDTKCSQKKEESESGSSDGDSCEDSKMDLIVHTNSFSHTSHIGGSEVEMTLKEETVDLEHQSKRLKLKKDQGVSLSSRRTIKAETQEPCLSVGEHSYTGRSPARLVNLASPNKAVKLEGESPSEQYRRSPCLNCCKNKTNVKSEEQDCCCGTSGQATQLSSESSQNSSEERVNDKIWTKKKKRKKKHEDLTRVKGKGDQLQQVDRMRPPSAESTKSAVRVARTIKRKDKKKKHKTGKKLESSKKIKDEPSIEPSFKLVCRSLEDLRGLISKTEDELDELESIKKRLGRWYYRREAVKDLHSTLIRLLNELSPWEPKLIKAYQRNRLRLKKDCDDFKKHPEYNNFVREESISSSSSSDDDDDDDEERGLGKEVCSSSDHYGRSEEEDLEHMVPRGLWSGGNTREFVAESAGERTLNYKTPNHIKQPLVSTVKNVSLLQTSQTGSSDITSNTDSGPQSRSEVRPSNQSKDSASEWAARVTTPASLSPRSTILHPTTGLPKGYTPIPTLLAKSVGNKVTLMKRPADFTGINVIDRQRKGSLVSLPNSTVTTMKLSKAQSFPSSSQQNLQQMQAQGQQRTEVIRQPGMAAGTAGLSKSPQTKPTQTVTKTPIQVVYKVPEGLGHLVRKDNSSPVKASVHPVVDHSTEEKIMQQLVILPSNLLIHKTEEKVSPLHQQSKVIPAPVSKVASPFCMPTNVPGFTISENRIPVQQVAPLKDARAVRTPSPSVSPRLQQGALNAAWLKGVNACSPQASTPHGVPPNPSPITTLSSAVSTEPIKSDLKQELKTVCIRDSQSILVTTRGGNTAIVKVQASSNQNALGSLPNSSVITISPQLKAFLVSKTSQTLSPSCPPQTSPCTFPAVTGISVAQPQKQVPSLSKSPSKLTTPMLAAVSGSIPVTGPGCQTAGTTVAISHGSNTSTVSTVATKIGQLAQTPAAGSHFQASLVKNTVVPSLSNLGVPQVLKQAEFTSKTGMKRGSTDERSQVTKFILVTPSSSSTSKVALSKATPSYTKSLPSSRVMFISQPTSASSTTSVGSTPKQAIASGVSGQLLSTSLSSQTLKMGLSTGQPVLSSEALSNVKNITLPSGVQIQLSGKTTTIGQTIGALSRSPSKNTPVSASDTGRPTATTTGSSNTITSCSAQLAANSSLITSCQLKGIPSFTMLSQPGFSTTSSAILPAGNVIKKDHCTPSSILYNNSPAQMVSMTTPGPGIQPQLTAVGTASPTTTPLQASVRMGTQQDSTSVRKTVPAVMQPVLAGARTQVLPTVAVPPIVSAVSRMQTLPVATVPPIGSTFNPFEAAPVVTAPSSSSRLTITPAQPIALLKANNTTHPPAVITNQALGKHCLSTSSLGMHTNVASRLLISSDSAILNTVQCQVKPVVCSKPLDALVVFPNSPTGALHEHDSSFQPSEADGK